MKNFRIMIVLALAFLSACGPSYRDTTQPMIPKPDLDAQRYLGLWYEIARYPVSFQSGCTGTTAEYGPIDSDTISVINTCRKGDPTGPVDQIKGQADIVGPGKLKVQFDNVPFVRGDYWVLWVDDAYQTAVVGVPSGKAGWVLARTPEISSAMRAKAEEALRVNGYDVNGLFDVPQPPQGRP